MNFKTLNDEELAIIHEKAKLARQDPQKKLLAKQKRQKKRLLKDAALALLQSTPDDDDLEILASLYGVPKEEVDNQMLALLAMFREALTGNTKAFELLMQASGQNNNYASNNNSAPTLNVQIVNVEKKGLTEKEPISIIENTK